MKNISPVGVVLGIIGIGTAISAAILYNDYSQLMEGIKISFNSVVVRSLSPQMLDFDLYLNFHNRSALDFQITSQEYKVFINNKQVSKISNSNVVKIRRNGISIIPAAVAIYPQKIGKSVGLGGLADMLVAPEKITLRIESKLFVKLWMLKVAIPYTYSTTLKDLIVKK